MSPKKPAKKKNPQTRPARLNRPAIEHAPPPAVTPPKVKSQRPKQERTYKSRSLNFYDDELVWYKHFCDTLEDAGRGKDKSSRSYIVRQAFYLLWKELKDKKPEGIQEWFLSRDQEQSKDGTDKGLLPPKAKRGIFSR